MDESQIAQLVAQLGFGAIFLVMLGKLWSEYQTLQKQYLEDLRDIAGIKQQLHQVQANVQAWRRSQEMLDETQPTKNT